jgi:hypothetical protein
MRPEELLKAALELPEQERAFLATRLLESMPAGDGETSLDHSSLFEELDRRFADLTGAVPASELWTGN